MWNLTAKCGRVIQSLAITAGLVVASSGTSLACDQSTKTAPCPQSQATDQGVLTITPTLVEAPQAVQADGTVAFSLVAEEAAGSQPNKRVVVLAHPHGQDIPRPVEVEVFGQPPVAESRATLASAFQSGPQWIIGVSVEPGGNHGKGIRITSVLEGRPADIVGLRKGDVISACNGIQLEKIEDLTNILQVVRDQTVTMTVLPSNSDLPREIPMKPVKVAAQSLFKAPKRHDKLADPKVLQGQVHPDRIQIENAIRDQARIIEFMELESIDRQAVEAEHNAVRLQEQAAERAHERAAQIAKDRMEAAQRAYEWHMLRLKPSPAQEKADERLEAMEERLQRLEQMIGRLIEAYEQE